MTEESKDIEIEEEEAIEVAPEQEAVEEDIDIEIEGDSDEPVEEEADPELEKALSNGYNPNYTGPGYKDPKAFNEYGNLYGQNRRLESQMKKIVDQNLKLQEQLKQDKIDEMRQSLEYLNSLKRKAVEDGDTDSYDGISANALEVQQKIQELSTPKSSDPGQAEDLYPEYTQAEKQQVLDQFRTTNLEWIDKQDHLSFAMKTAADSFSGTLMEQGIPLKTVLDHTNAMLRKEFPQAFTRSKPRSSAPAVESKSSSSKGGSTSGIRPKYRLTSQMAKIAKEAGMTPSEYIKYLPEQTRKSLEKK